jgi:hypothetical protein
MRTSAVKTLLVIPVVLFAALREAPAFADEKAACFEAAGKGQTLRDAHKLVEARVQFRICAAATCPPAVQTDCTGWLGDADKAVPTVVLSAKDVSGEDAFDVSVSLDGTPVAARLDGAAIPVDPGPHTFRFQWPDGTTVDRQTLVPEGQKAMVVSAVRAAAPTAPPQPVSTAPAVAKPSDGPWHTIGWIVGGVGVAGIGLGVAFTAVTLSDKSAAQCNSAGVCSKYSSVSSARSAAPVAGTGLIGGSALVLAGAALLLFTRESTEAPAQARDLHVAPMIAREANGVSLIGTW